MRNEGKGVDIEKGGLSESENMCSVREWGQKGGWERRCRHPAKEERQGGQREGPMEEGSGLAPLAWNREKKPGLRQRVSGTDG